MSSQDVHLEEQLTDPESGWTWFISLASMVILIVTVVICTVIFFVFEDDEIEDKVFDKPAMELTELRGEQEGLLSTYQSYSEIPMGGTEADAVEKIRIPIDKAMEVLVARSRKDSASAAGGTTGDSAVVDATGKEAVGK